jgi:hypothetical protein
MCTFWHLVIQQIAHNYVITDLIVTWQLSQFIGGITVILEQLFYHKMKCLCFGLHTFNFVCFHGSVLNSAMLKSNGQVTTAFCFYTPTLDGCM